MSRYHVAYGTAPEPPKGQFYVSGPQLAKDIQKEVVQLLESDPKINRVVVIRDSLDGCTIETIQVYSKFR